MIRTTRKATGGGTGRTRASSSPARAPRTPSPASPSRFLFCSLYFRVCADAVLQGTVTTSVAELLVDIAYHPVQSTAAALPNVHVSSGVYMTLFEPFKSLGGQAPFGPCAGRRGRHQKLMTTQTT
jgi:hypothetical protein